MMMCVDERASRVLTRSEEGEEVRKGDKTGVGVE